MFADVVIVLGLISSHTNLSIERCCAAIFLKLLGAPRFAFYCDYLAGPVFACFSVNERSEDT